MGGKSFPSLKSNFFQHAIEKSFEQNFVYQLDGSRVSGILAVLNFANWRKLPNKELVSLFGLSKCFVAFLVHLFFFINLVCMHEKSCNI